MKLIEPVEYYSFNEFAEDANRVIKTAPRDIFGELNTKLGVFFESMAYNQDTLAIESYPNGAIERALKSRPNTGIYPVNACGTVWLFPVKNPLRAKYIAYNFYYYSESRLRYCDDSDLPDYMSTVFKIPCNNPYSYGVDKRMDPLPTIPFLIKTFLDSFVLVEIPCDVKLTNEKLATYYNSPNKLFPEQAYQFILRNMDCW